MESAKEFFVFVAVSFLCLFTGTGYGYIGGAISDDLIAAAAISPTITAPLIMFSGYFSRESSLSKAFYWIKYLSAFNFGYQAYSINEFTDLPIDQAEFGTDTPLKEAGITSELWQNIGALLLLALGQILLVLMILKYKANNYRNN
jgi:hypothetical protein